MPSGVSSAAAAIAAAGPLVARGLGRSYGDSALSDRVLGTRYLDHYLGFDDSAGFLTCEAGVTFDDLLRDFVPRGWFPPVTPGTRFVTVGGAIASDVHGKNHHVDGSFCEHVEWLEIILGNGDRVRASRAEHADLFHATCGGMGLTGLIVAASFRLRRIGSGGILEKTIRAASLDDTVTILAETAHHSYSVAWIDCYASGSALGRSVVMLGEHAPVGALAFNPRRPVSVPCEMPAMLLNPLTIGAFNALYYHGAPRSSRQREVSLEAFFYPLDALSQWNRLYGKAGLVQYQCVIPERAGATALRALLERVVDFRGGSFLGVLKVFGPRNRNLLSFPEKGYTLALDFHASRRTLDFLDKLDRLILDAGGRLYLAKDARMSPETFRSAYPRWQEFEAVREKYRAVGKFRSLQSRRLGLQ